MQEFGLNIYIYIHRYVYIYKRCAYGKVVKNTFIIRNCRTLLCMHTGTCICGGPIDLRAPPPPPCKSHIGELAPMALCDIHVAGCGEHLPAWSLGDDRIPGTDQAVRGGRHGQKVHSGFPPQGQGDTPSSADACLS